MPRPPLHPRALVVALVPALLLLLQACHTPPSPRGDLPPELYETIAVAEAGDPVAQTVVGSMYETGVFGKPDYRAAARWYDRAVRQGDALAAFYLGGLFEGGQGVGQDFASAAHLYRMAAEWGHVSAAFKLGYLYEKGLGVEQDFTQARVWYDLVQHEGGQALLPSYITASDGAVVEADPATAQAVLTSYQVHLGSEQSIEAAMAQWQIVRNRHPDLLGELTPALATLELAGGATYYQLLAGPLADATQADLICGRLQPLDQYCNPVAP
ncbi:MAG: hypothetical protein CMM46_02695 [Rhodospirillaceae bacterium]|nr:hypothetical protein [Rhodospirillaceae bacterium]|tara:strand:+ start:2883 stop:3689 length:807 start_codon:yes stop_codon:yes gene_type:complete